MAKKEKEKEAEETELKEVTDPEIIKAVKSTKYNRTSKIELSLKRIMKAGKVGGVYETTHNPGAISRQIKKLKYGDKLKVRQRTIDGEEQIFIERVA